MKNGLKYLIFNLLMLYIVLPADAQLMLKADDYYNNLAFQEAIKKYQKIVNKEPENGDALFKLANSYRLNGQSIEAEKWFANAVNYSTLPECRLFYAQMLLVNEKYAQAANWFEKYSAIAPTQYDVANAKMMARYCKKVAEKGVEEKNVIITPVNFNSDKLDFCPSYWGDDRLIFASNRKENKKKDAWTSDNYVDLYYVAKDSAYSPSAVKPFGDNINSIYHEGPSVFDAANNKLFITRNDYIDRKRGYDDKNNTRLQIYSSALVSNGWGKLEKLPFNSNEYSCCHPAISADGTVLVFASDMQGGFGGMDLYASYWDGSNWSTPENLGLKINTAGNELFPFIHKNGKLYFASNMHIGIGGLDIFVAENTDIGIWEDPVNIGAPINSPKDDFGFIVDNELISGYFTSNRSGEDDIYSFLDKTSKDDELELISTSFYEGYNDYGEKHEYICGKVINKNYKTPLANANVKLYNKCTGEVDSATTDKYGNFTFPMNVKCNYVVLAKKLNFTDNGHRFSTFDTVYTTQCIEMTIPLTFIEEIIPQITSEISVKEGMIFELYNVYFDFDMYNIREEASWDLDSLLTLLRKYPEMRGELSAHTDSRGTFDYNIKLSENRAKSAKEYLIKNGIVADRITTKGYGETKLKNECADGVDCDELKHQMNRRVEFRVDYVGGTATSKEHVKYRTKPKTSNKKSL